MRIPSACAGALGAIPRRGIYDNMTTAVDKLGRGKQRQVNVRRFFTMIEVSVKQGTIWAVFESNNETLWVKVRTQIETYLTQLWRSGALAGARPEQAFYVSCGLGQTMTAQDIQQGRMMVEIGMAAVPPAEFIIL